VERTRRRSRDGSSLSRISRADPSAWHERQTHPSRQGKSQVRFLIRDGAGQFVAAFDEVFRSDGATVIRTPPRTPVANAYAERWVGTVRRELLDRTLIWNRRQLERHLRDYVEHYNTHRPHRTLGQRAPDNTEIVEYRPAQPIRRHPTRSGLINEYRHAA
jgi:putative transposase